MKYPVHEIPDLFAGSTAGRLKEILREEGFVLAYLFGSSARGKADAKSDVDLALVAKRPLGSGKKVDSRLKLMAKVGPIFRARDTDVVFYEDLPLHIRFEVLKYGKVLLCDDPDRRIALEHHTMSRYRDRLYYINRHTQLAIKRVAAHGILK